MLARRSRAQVKPNIAKGSKLARSACEKNNLSPVPSAETNPIDDSVQPPIVTDDTTEILQSDTAVAEEVALLPDTQPKTAAILVACADTRDDQDANVDPLAPKRRVAHEAKHMIVLSPKKDATAFSPESKNLPRPRKKFTDADELDPKKMRMMDMIYWNPKKEKGMSKSYADVESVVDDGKSSLPDHGSTSKVAAPQVKLGPDGRLIIDEKSLIIAEPTSEQSVWETIDEDKVSRKVTSLSFRNRMWRRGSVWTEKETELFYEILRCTGPDFGLMHEFFPSRARNELKSKYNREERVNWERLNEVMSRPALLDNDLFEKAAAMQRDIEQEAYAKKMSKEKYSFLPFCKRRKNKKEELWDENSADLFGEAYAIIQQMENEGSESKQHGLLLHTSTSARSHNEESTPSEEERTEGIKHRAKKLSAKAQELLNQTLRNVKSEILHEDKNPSELEKVYDGYDEGDCEVPIEEVDEDDDDDDDDDTDYVPRSTKPVAQTSQDPVISSITTRSKKTCDEITASNHEAAHAAGDPTPQGALNDEAADALQEVQQRRIETSGPQSHAQRKRYRCTTNKPSRSSRSLRH